jgi:hypothetical protein
MHHGAATAGESPRYGIERYCYDDDDDDDGTQSNGIFHGSIAYFGRVR